MNTQHWLLKISGTDSPETSWYNQLYPTVTDVELKCHCNVCKLLKMGEKMHGCGRKCYQCANLSVSSPTARCQALRQKKSLRLVLPNTNGPAGASTTPQHHLSDPYGGYHSMVWRQLMWFCDHKWGQIWFRFADDSQISCQLPSQVWHGLSPGQAGASTIPQHHSSDPHMKDSFNGLEATDVDSWSQKWGQFWFRFPDDS
jgi:hypothetical protein